jgi:hypothetical protein
VAYGGDAGWKVDGYISNKGINWETNTEIWRI